MTLRALLSVLKRRFPWFLVFAFFTLAVYGAMVKTEVVPFQNMARIMVGTLVEIGRGKMQPEAIDALFASRDRTAAGMTAPPGGLYLVEVYYE